MSVLHLETSTLVDDLRAFVSALLDVESFDSDLDEDIALLRSLRRVAMRISPNVPA